MFIRRRAFSLLEVMLAAAILAVLSVVTFELFRSGLWSWKRASGVSVLLQDLNTATAQLTAWLQRSSADSLLVATDHKAISGLDCKQGDQPVQLGATGAPIWQKYRVAYLDGTTLRLRDVELLASAPQRGTPTTILAYDGGAGVQPFSSYLAGGRVLCENLQTCRFTLEGDRILIEYRLEHHKFRSSRPELLSVQTSVLARN